MNRATVLLLPLLLIGCASVPYGEFEGGRVTRTNAEVFDAVVVAVDGKAQLDLPTRVLLKPGFHLLQVASRHEAASGKLAVRALPLQVEPCVRYRFEAKRTHAFNPGAWELVRIDATEIASCKSKRD